MHLINNSLPGQPASMMPYANGSSPLESLNGATFGAFQTLLMGMMSSIMAMMSSGVLGQVMDAGQGGGLVSGQNPSFGGGGSPGLGNATRGFLGAAPNSTPRGGSSGGGGGDIGRATGEMVSRPGGRMDASIAGNFDAMVAAAKKDGVNLQISSALRTRAEQERLYAAYKNGTGNLAAKPGTSNHESGQAFDFKNTPGAYKWLASNAERFGFKNLPGEPWHYSVDGR